MPTHTHPGTLAVLLAVAGCGGANGDLTGTVTHGGKVLTGGSVQVRSSAGTVHVGGIRPDGTYAVGGVPPGPAAVLVACPSPAARDDAGKAAARPGRPRPAGGTGASCSVPDKYGDFETSGLTVTVRPGGQTHDIELK